MLKKLIRAADTCINIMGIAALIIIIPMLFVVVAFYVLLSLD